MSANHRGYAVPVRRDRDGSPIVLCYWDSQAGTGPAEYWAIWCSTCAEVVSPPLEGSLGLVDLDGAPESQANIVLRDEERMSVAHAIAMGQHSHRNTEYAAPTTSGGPTSSRVATEDRRTGEASDDLIALAARG